MEHIDRIQQRAVQEILLYADTDNWLIHVFTVRQRQATSIPQPGEIQLQEQAQEKLTLVWPQNEQSRPEYLVVLPVAYFVVRLNEVTVVDLHKVAKKPEVAEQLGWSLPAIAILSSGSLSYASCVGVPVADPYAVRLLRDLPQLSGVVTFSSDLLAERIVNNERLRRVLSKHAELLVEATDQPDLRVDIEPMLNITSLPSDRRPGPQEGWTEFVPGAFTPQYALAEYDRIQARRKQSAEYYRHNFG